jgi:predicted ATPase/DNA-binding CsgD family transcriptional regulator
MHRTQVRPSEHRFEPLTRREREVLALLAEGCTIPDIVARLTLATSSVKSHLQHLYRKLGVKGSREAVSRAVDMGLIGRPSLAPKPPSHNLPIQITRWFGRDAEVEQLRAHLSEARLVTLTGVGGVGKTRLALQTAETLVGHFPGGVWLVELASLSDPALVPQAMTSALGVKDQSGRPVLEALKSHLRARQLLVVLDNCEHLVEACAGLVEALLTACPGFKVLATSREALTTAGEVTFPVPSLPVPTLAQTRSLELVRRSAAVQLLVDRARLVQPQFTLTHDNAAAVTQICRRLDGIPLAIEMAAARVSVLSAEEVAARLNESLRSLTYRRRTALPKHQTLWATLNWSYQLLDESDQCLLRRLSVFAGGCTLEAAQVVCGDGELGPEMVLDGMEALVTKSLVIADHRLGLPTHYRLLEMVRQFSAEQLDLEGETARLRANHLNYFLAFAEEMAPQVQFAARTYWAARLGPERDNLRLALKSAFDEPARLASWEAGPRLVLTVASFGFSYPEQIEWAQRAVAWCELHPKIPEVYLARLKYAYAYALAIQDGRLGAQWAQQAVDSYRRLDLPDRRPLLSALSRLCSVCVQHQQGLERATAALDEAERLYQSLGPDFVPESGRPRWEMGVHIDRARIANDRGDHHQANQHCAEALRLAPLAGESEVFIIETTWGHACFGLKEYDEAERHIRAALAATDEHDPVYQRTFWANWWLGFINLTRGDLDQASTHCRLSLSAASELTEYGIVVAGLEVAAIIAARRGQAQCAARLSGSAAALHEQLGQDHRDDSSVDAMLPGWRDGPNRNAIQAAYDAGLAMSADEAASFALADDAA